MQCAGEHVRLPKGELLDVGRRFEARNVLREVAVDGVLIQGRSHFPKLNSARCSHRRRVVRRERNPATISCRFASIFFSRCPPHSRPAMVAFAQNRRNGRRSDLLMFYPALKYSSEQPHISLRSVSELRRTNEKKCDLLREKCGFSPSRILVLLQFSRNGSSLALAYATHSPAHHQLLHTRFTAL